MTWVRIHRSFKVHFTCNHWKLNCVSLLIAWFNLDVVETASSFYLSVSVRIKLLHPKPSPTQQNGYAVRTASNNNKRAVYSSMLDTSKLGRTTPFGRYFTTHGWFSTSANGTRAWGSYWSNCTRWESSSRVKEGRVFTFEMTSAASAETFSGIV